MKKIYKLTFAIITDFTYEYIVQKAIINAKYFSESEIHAYRNS